MFQFIYIIDSDASYIDLLVKTFNKIDSNVGCVTSINSEEALNTLSDIIAAPAIILLNINIIKADRGLCLRTIKTLFSGVGVVVYSPYVSIEYQKITEELGATFYIFNPYQSIEVNKFANLILENIK
ncbi:MAG TPA: hypothetical protein VD908_14070 [Cytophagales bacterium]|nr:hypothetical protein [Cytophagales bacterium]